MGKFLRRTFIEEVLSTSNQLDIQPLAFIFEKLLLFLFCYCFGDLFLFCFRDLFILFRRGMFLNLIQFAKCLVSFLLRRVEVEFPVK